LAFTFRDFWRKFWALVQDDHAELDLDALAADWQAANRSRKSTSYREVTIGKVLYRLTSVFEGTKDLDKTMERLAIQNAIDPSKPQEKA